MAGIWFLSKTTFLPRVNKETPMTALTSLPGNIVRIRGL